MDREQIESILQVAKLLPDSKSLYDYMVVILPVLTAFLGWLLSTWQQSYTFRLNTRKEHYYRMSEKVELIMEDFNNFLQYIDQYNKLVRGNANLLRPIPPDDFSDFVTKYQSMLGSIHQRLRIIFPGKRFPIEEVANSVKRLERNILQINDILQFKMDMAALQTKISTNNNSNEATVVDITYQVARIEDKIIDVLTNSAKQLGIRK